MKYSTHVRMCVDVLRAWKDELGFDVESEEVLRIVREANGIIDGYWFAESEDEAFPMPHHRTRYCAPTTAKVIRFHALCARSLWLNAKENGKKLEGEDFVLFLKHLVAAMHIAQDFAAWSTKPRKHDPFEEAVDRLYDEMREELRKKKYRGSRKKFYKMYWELSEGVSSTTNYPKSYIEEAYRRSSELLSWVISERRMDRETAYDLIDKYRDNLPETLEEVKYWENYGYPIAWLGTLPVFASLLLAALGIISGFQVLAIELLWVGGTVLLYIVCKILQRRRNKIKYDIYPDGADYLLREHYRNMLSSDGKMDLSKPLVEQIYIA